MKPMSKRFIVLVTFLGLAANAYPQSPREQFQSAVATFQKSATEENARKVAEIHKQLNPPPAVPEDAQFRALKGMAFVKQGTDAAAFAKAAVEFQAAIGLAPWVGEYHYNLAVCEKAAGRFTAAQTALRYAQIFARDDKERRDGLALRAELEAAQELAVVRKGQEDKVSADNAAAEKERLRPTVEGTWQGGILSFRIVRNGERFTIVEGNLLGIKAPTTWRARNVVADGQRIRFQGEADNPGVRLYPAELSLSPDGSTLSGWFLAPNGTKSPATMTRVP